MNPAAGFRRATARAAANKDLKMNELDLEGRPFA
jgi:hypothetical protein